MCPIAHAGIFYDLVFALFIHSFVVSHIYMEFLINVCSKCKWQFQFMNILLLFLFSSTINRLEAKTFVYNYVTNISENSYKEAVLDILSGRVYITPIILNEIVEESDEISKRLWHVTLIIDGKTSIEDEVTLNCLTLFDHKGLIDRIFISRSTLKKGVTEINIFKGLLSLFNIHHRFEPGIEIDSSGKCQVTYATTAIGDTIVTTSGNHRTTPDNIIIIDKEKTLCERLQRPIDVWNENSLSVVDFKEVREILTRYKYDKSTHQILEVYAYERQIHSFIDLSNTNYVEYQQLINSTGINLVTWQKLEFIDETDNQDKRIQNIVDQHYDFSLDEITEILFGSDYQTIHLGIVYPVSKSQTCSLNANLFTAFMNEDEISEKKKNANLIYLRQHIESYRDWLQNDAIGSIKSAEAILNLTSLLRCLSETNQSLSILTSATMLAPPATEIQSIYRQLNTWRDHLIDILINCGTSTCLTIVFNRLNTLTHFVYSNQSDHDQHSLEVVKSKEMLFTKLWPSLSHIRRLNIEQVNQLYEACEKSIIIDENYVCLMTLVNLNLREVYDFKQIIQHIQKLLDISNSKVENLSSFKSKINRNNLLMGLAMTKKLHHPGLTRSLLKIIFDHDNIPSVIRTLAIRVIGEVHFSQQARNRQTHNSLIYNPYEQQLAEIRTRLIEMLYKLPKKSHDDLLIGQEIFKVLLLSELSVVHLARILSDMAKQERWSFIQICRQFIQQWCKMELLTRDECNCLGVLTLNSAYSTTCQLGLAGGWSGLTGDQSEEIGQATLLQSELSSLNNALLIDYTSYFVLDPYGGLQLSDLCVSVVSKEGESVIFDLSIQADELTSLAPSKKQTTSTTSTSSTGTWLSFDLTYLGISLLPQEVFSGGVVDIVRLLWSSSGQLTPLLQVLKLPIDQRIQTTLTSGWIIQIDNVAALSLSISSGLEASIWKQSGKSHARTQIGLVSEIKINLIQQTDQPTINIQIHNSSFITKGIAIQGYVDFITEIDIKNLPDSVCLLMDQGVDTYVVQWYSIDSSGYFLSDTAISPSARTHDGSGLTADNNKKMYHHSNYTLQPVSYFLGYDNSMKCRKMKTG